MKILYFTGTGNSLYVAKSIGGELCSIPKMVKEGTLDFTDEKIGIVFPIYAWSVPPYVVDFLKKATINCEYLFAIMTYGIYSGGAANHLLNVAKEVDLDFSYINRIKMVDNYLPTFDMEKQIENEPKKEIEKHLETIKSDILDSKKWRLKDPFLKKLGTNLMLKRAKKNPNKETLMGYAIGNGIKNFVTIEDSCTRCGTCSRVCPTNNIRIDKKSGKIVLGNKCITCMACIHHCPTNSIRLKGERSKVRFRNSNVSLSEIIESNN